MSLRAKPHMLGAYVFSCNLHFRQNDWDLLCATAVMGGRMDTEIRAQKVDQGKEKSPART